MWGLYNKKYCPKPHILISGQIAICKGVSGTCFFALVNRAQNTDHLHINGHPGSSRRTGVNINSANIVPKRERADIQGKDNRLLSSNHTYDFASETTVRCSDWLGRCSAECRIEYAKTPQGIETHPIQYHPSNRPDGAYSLGFHIYWSAQ